MADLFERRIQSAAIAGWWVVLLGSILLTVSWLAYLCFLTTQPAWLASLWGPEVTWEEMQVLWLWALVVFKMVIWLMVMVTLWLTLWARQLRKSTPS